MKNSLVHVEMIDASKITKSGLDLSMSAEMQKAQNNLPFKVLTIDADNPTGLVVGDYVYLRPGCSFFKMHLEHEDAVFINQFDVIAVTKSFDFAKHTAIAAVSMSIS